MGPQSILILGVPALAAAVAVLLILLGRRSRIVGDHPVCGACGYDLFGRPAESSRCSECGTELGLAGAVVIGQRIPRRRLLWSGRGLLAASMVALIWGGWWQASRVPWIQYKPMWWLMRDARSGEPAARHSVCAELTRRVAAGGLKQAHLDAAADFGLDVLHAPALADADREWGDFIEAAHATKRLSSDRWERYASGGWEWNVKVRARIRRGDPIPLLMTVDGRRHASRPAFFLKYEGWLDLVDRHGVTKRFAVGGHGTHWDDPHRIYFEPIKPDDLGGLAEGRIQVRLTGQATCVADLWGRDRLLLAKPFAFEATAAFMLLDANTPTVILVKGPDQRERVAKALRLPSLEVMACDRGWCMGLAGKIAATDLPVGVCSDYVCRVGDKEYAEQRGGIEFASRPGVQEDYLEVWWLPNSFAAKTVDIVFRPNPAEAAETFDIFEMCAEEIVIPNVAVVWPPGITPGTSQPTTSPDDRGDGG